MRPQSTDKQTQSVAIDFAVSVCHIKHIEVWEVTQAAIAKFVPSRHHILVVPDQDLTRFQSVTGDHIRVEPESQYIGEFEGTLRSALEGVGEPRRYGSYLQQFIKLAVLKQYSAEERLLIWDADTVPLQPLRFFDASGHVHYFAEHRAHAPMFEQIYRLLGSHKCVKRSFIAQSFPLFGLWAQSFFESIERTGAPWWTRLVETIPWHRGSALSEYELLGSYIAQNWGEKIIWNDSRWIRNGYQYVDGPQDSLSKGTMPNSAPFAAFEEYDRPCAVDSASSVDPKFESIVVINRRVDSGRVDEIVFGLNVTCFARGRLVYFGSLQGFESVRLSNKCIMTEYACTVLTPFPHERGVSESGDERAIIKFGMPGPSGANQKLFWFNPGVCVAPLSEKIVSEHPASGHLIGTNEADVIVRYWMELVDWQDSDEDMRKNCSRLLQVKVPAVAWQELNLDRYTVVVIDAPGIEQIALSTLLESCASREVEAPRAVVIRALFLSAETETKLKLCGFMQQFLSTENTATEPRTFVYVRPGYADLVKSTSQDSSLSK